MPSLLLTSTPLPPSPRPAVVAQRRDAQPQPHRGPAAAEPVPLDLKPGGAAARPGAYARVQYNSLQLGSCQWQLLPHDPKRPMPPGLDQRGLCSRMHAPLRTPAPPQGLQRALLGLMQRVFPALASHPAPPIQHNTPYFTMPPTGPPARAVGPHAAHVPGAGRRHAPPGRAPGQRQLWQRAHLHRQAQHVGGGCAGAAAGRALDSCMHAVGGSCMHAAPAHDGRGPLTATRMALLQLQACCVCACEGLTACSSPPTHT